MFLQIFSALCVLTLISESNSARILGVFHFPARSQHVLGTFLLQELASRGHQVTMISPFVEENTVANYTQVKVDNGLLDYLKKNSDMAQKMLKGEPVSVIEKIKFIPKAFQDFGRLFIESPELKAFLSAGHEFDLVIQLWNMNEAFLGIGDHFRAPTIAFCSVGASPLINGLFGNPAPYAMTGNVFMPTPETFIDRVQNTISSGLFQMLVSFALFPYQKELLAKHFPNAPPLNELMDNVNVALLNSHPAVEGSLPYMPNMIQIGGFHIEKTTPLPKDLQTFMDNAKEGVILFCLGSNVKPSSLPKPRLDNIIKVLSSLPQKVIFKYDDEMPNVPKNMYVSKWIPQTSILAHKNIKVFATHSGLGGIAEAIYNAVPVLCIPFFGDQLKNAQDAIKRGFGIKMDISELDDDTMARNIEELIKNPIYKQTISATSDFYRSQPMKPLDKAVFWVEHVLKHKGAKHFTKSIGAGQAMYQYLLLDVIAFLGALLLSVLFVAYFIVKKTMCFICKSLGLCKSSTSAKTPKATKSKKKN